MGLCQGEPINFQDLRTEQQKRIMAALEPMLMAGLQRGATPYPGPLSAPMDIAQIAALNTMMGLGGYGGYTPPSMPAYPLPSAPMPMYSPWEYTPGNQHGQGGKGTYGGEDWWTIRDPYAPRFRRREK